MIYKNTDKIFENADLTSHLTIKLNTEKNLICLFF